jgi:hypothetical protein
MAIVRVKTNQGSNVVWDYITTNHKELEKGFDNCVELMYITKREKYDDTSLFIQSGNPDCFGDFVSKIIAPIPGVDEVWMINLLNMKFYHLEEKLLSDWQRYVVTIRSPPNKFLETYNALSHLTPTSNASPVYLAYTFHLYGDSIMFSFLAEDLKAANKYVEENIITLPEVFRTNIVGIQREQRLTSPESWKIQIKSNLLPQPVAEQKHDVKVAQEKPLVSH